MSEFVDLIAGMGVHTASCRMAYTLGRTQPVLCTLLGNDPFFFDVDPEAVADHLDDVLSLETAEFPVPESLRAARTTSEGFVTLGDDIDGLPLTDDLAAFCRDALKPAAALVVEEAVALLSISSTASVLQDHAKAHNVVVRGDDSIQGVCFDQEAGVMRVNPALGVDRAALLLCRELRRMQLRDIHDSLKTPESAILINRALQAELAVLPIQVAWELSLAGHRSAWDLVSASPLADIAYAFGHRANTDFRALRDGRAQMAAFDQWFYSGRTRKADRALIQCLLALSDEIASAPKANPNLTVESLRRIGERGVGRNYLIDNMMMLTQDGFYGDVRDRSNANFLWFVKFERSYRQAETYLEEQKKTEEKMATPTGAVILAFPVMPTKGGRKTAKTARK